MMSVTNKCIKTQFEYSTLHKICQTCKFQAPAVKAWLQMGLRLNAMTREGQHYPKKSDHFAVDRQSFS